MDANLRAGVAIYNAGRYHLESGTDDERFLHGLIQFTAAVFHARGRNWSGATGLAESGRDYLDGLPATYRGVDVAGVRTYLAGLASDPERIERVPPPDLTYEGRALAFADLDFPATAVAAEVLAEELDYDEGTVESAVEYARADLDAGDEGSRFVTFLFDFVREPENRAIVVQRLDEHVQRRASRERDVEGLFE
ncbi:MAG: DUF309 domain-containing protein [Haloarculaceae archaeon]